MTSNDPVVNSVIETVAPVELVKTKSKMKGDGTIEIDDDYLDENFHYNNL